MRARVSLPPKIGPDSVVRLILSICKCQRPISHITTVWWQRLPWRKFRGKSAGGLRSECRLRHGRQSTIRRLESWLRPLGNSSVSKSCCVIEYFCAYFPLLNKRLPFAQAVCLKEATALVAYAPSSDLL